MFCFYGSYNYQLDAKNRMRMPAKFRAEMGDEYLITKGSGGCLFVLDHAALENMNIKMAEQKISDAEANAAIRFFTSSAVQVDFDEQGRFILPQSLKTFAKIDKNVCIIGAGNKVEIWSQEVWEKLEAEHQKSGDDIFANLSKIGI